MNKRLMVAICAILLLLICWWAWSRRADSGIIPKGSTVSIDANTAGAAGKPQDSIKTVLQKSASARQTVDPKAALIEGLIKAENDKSLDFYGKVIDQDGKPVSGVKVRAGVGLVVSFTQSGGHFVDTESDSGGNFHFLGIHGAGMGPFILSKDGYSYNQNAPTSSRPSNYIPDPEGPVIFHVWKQKGPEPMIHARVHAYVPCDGTPSSYNILAGGDDPAGDLVITLTRNPIQIQRGRRFDWSATVEIRNGGGLIPINENETYPNEAPADGYEQKVTIVDMPASSKDWNNSFGRSYYFMSRNGKIYGRIAVNIQADFQPPPTSFDVDIIANPAGSRNLEYIPDN